MRQQAEEIFRAALKAVDPIEAVFRYVKLVDGALQVGERRFEFKDYDRILVVGAGKAGAPMARALEDLLGDRISDGVIVVKEGHGLPLQHVRIHEAGHPVPDERGIQGAEDILALVSEAGERDLVLCVISGGGSALLVAPAEGVTPGGQAGSHPTSFGLWRGHPRNQYGQKTSFPRQRWLVGALRPSGYGGNSDSFGCHRR